MPRNAAEGRHVFERSPTKEVAREATTPSVQLVSAVDAVPSPLGVPAAVCAAEAAVSSLSKLVLPPGFGGEPSAAAPVQLGNAAQHYCIADPQAPPYVVDQQARQFSEVAQSLESAAKALREMSRTSVSTATGNGSAAAAPHPTFSRDSQFRFGDLHSSPAASPKLVRRGALTPRASTPRRHPRGSPGGTRPEASPVPSSTERSAIHQQHVQQLEAEIAVLHERLQEQIDAKASSLEGKDWRVQELKKQLYALIHAERAAAESRRRSEQDLQAVSRLESDLHAATMQAMATETNASARRKTYVRLRELENGLAAQEEANAMQMILARDAEQALNVVRAGSDKSQAPRPASDASPLRTRLAEARAVTSAREQLLAELRQRTAAMSAEVQQVSKNIATANGVPSAGTPEARLEEARAAVRQAAELRKAEATKAEALATELQEMRQSVSGADAEVSELCQNIGEGSLAADLRALRVCNAAAGVDAAKSDPSGQELIDPLAKVNTLAWLV